MFNASSSIPGFAHLLCDPAHMLDLQGALHVLHVLLDLGQQVCRARLDPVVPGLGHGRVFGSQEHRVLSAG